jgi:hypothetical protein
MNINLGKPRNRLPLMKSELADLIKYPGNGTYLAMFNEERVALEKDIIDLFGLLQHDDPKIERIKKGFEDSLKILKAKANYKGKAKALKEIADLLDELEVELHSLNASKNPKSKVSKELRGILFKIPPSAKRKFLEEAINCYEVGACRASIIMTWILIMDTLQEYILAEKLNEFNSALSRQQGLRINRITSIDDFTELNEAKFIEICRSATIITHDIRKILDEKLGFRNSCAHRLCPKSAKIA